MRKAEPATLLTTDHLDGTRVAMEMGLAHLAWFLILLEGFGRCCASISVNGHTQPVTLIRFQILGKHKHAHGTEVVDAGHCLFQHAPRKSQGAGR